MGSISVPTIIALAGTAVSAGGAAYESHEQGVATSNADKQKATQAGIQGQQQQIDQRQKLLSALATQNAQAGGAGLSKAGTLRQIDQEQNDLMVTSANTSSQVSLLDQAASNATSAGDIGAVGDLAGGAAKGASIYQASIKSSS